MEIGKETMEVTVVVHEISENNTAARIKGVSGDGSYKGLISASYVLADAVATGSGETIQDVLMDMLELANNVSRKEL